MTDRARDKIAWACEDGYIADVLARGASIAEDWPVQDSRRRSLVPGSDLEANPLREYFETTAKEGPGIIKWRHYFDPYHVHLAKFIGRSPVVVEIGVWSGGGLKMWREYFGPGCRIHGVDKDPGCSVFADDSTTIHVGYQGDPEFWKAFRHDVPEIDVVIDDGSHHPEDQIRTMEALLHHVRRGGVYICEDLCGRGHPFLAMACAMMDRFHAFDEFVNQQMDRPEAVGRPTPLQANVSGFHVYPYMVVVEKRELPLRHLSSQKHGTEWRPDYWEEKRA